MLQVSVPIAHELLEQCIKQGQALVQRASLVGDFSDYESWKSARRQWIEPTVQALEHLYGDPSEAREFVDAVTCAEGVKRWQEQYATDLKCVEEAIELLSTLQGELAFAGEGAPTAQEMTASSPYPRGAAELTSGERPPDTDAAEQPREAPVEHERVTASNGASNGAGVAQSPMPERPPMPEPQAPNEGSFAEPDDEVSAFDRAVGAELTPAQRPGSELAHHANGSTPAEREPADEAPVRTRARQVLLAHGRDERWKQAVEHLLEQAGEDEIRIINRRSGERGRLAEALGEEQPPGTRYAVVLLTADDVGGPRLESDAEPYFSTRAHQEVVFEMGFLVAALSPGRVCVLYEDGVELPYDLEGVSHVRLDLAGTWQPKLLLHLRRAGFDYDVNKLASV